MHTLVIYDISEDKIRNRIAEVCKDYGLARIQWSAFLGNLNNNRREELYLRLMKTLKNNQGNIQLYPICSKDICLKKEINNGGADDHT
ncbi:MAG TPA: CRISPR-associated endonuclease Cas2 [Halanaerobiales bacterium]|nr:CRISPR-associated endonuclease Cas2 [Halanaerobiales bacterium]